MKLQVPVIRAVMGRRILANFRVRPDVLRPLLPAPFRPKIVQGWGLCGICLIRLEQMRPRFLSPALGMSSENAAHRIAIEWDEAGGCREGVYIPRRDTDSWLNVLAGGRLFPGVHHRASFRSEETGRQFRVEMRSVDRKAIVRVSAQRTDTWPGGSVFPSLEQASEFLRGGCCGWSPNRSQGSLEGVELRTDHWDMHSLKVDDVESSFFSDTERFASGTVEFDSALLMQGISHSWRALKLEGPRLGPRRRHRHGPSALFEMP